MGKDESRVEELYELFFKLARPVVRRILWSEDDTIAWDIASKGVLAMGEKYKEEGNLEAWFYRLAKNECFERLRAERHRNEKSIEELSEVEFASLSVGNNGELAIRLKEVEYLPGEEHMVRRILEGYSLEEVAWEMGVHYNTIRKRWKEFIERQRRKACRNW